MLRALNLAPVLFGLIALPAIADDATI